VAQVLEQNPNSRFVAIANATPGSSSNLPNTLYAPAIFNYAYGSFVTGANIINPSDTSNLISITYYDSNGVAYTAPTFSLPGRGLIGVYQGSTTTATGLPNGGLPKGFVGSAIVSSSGSGIVMVVNEIGSTTQSGSSESGVYSAISQGGSNIGLPAMANNGFGYTTGTTILNTSAGPVEGVLQYYNSDGTLASSGSQTFTIAAHAGKNIFQGSSGLPASFYGTAVISQTSGTPNALLDTTNAVSANFFYTYTEPLN
jgi:hypothetical protein